MGYSTDSWLQERRESFRLGRVAKTKRRTDAFPKVLGLFVDPALMESLCSADQDISRVSIVQEFHYGRPVPTQTLGDELSRGLHHILIHESLTRTPSSQAS